MKLDKVLLGLCVKRGISLSKLAKLANVPKPTIHGWTTGRSALNMDHLKRVATILQVSLHELLFGEPDPFEQKVESEEILRELFTGNVRVTLHRIEKRTKG